MADGVVRGVTKADGFWSRLRWGIVLLAGAVLAACSNTPEQAARTFDPNDPWGIHIAAASERFDIPEQWIREVMWVESRGETHLFGGPTTSHAGAMGLMQIMPGTWRELAGRYGLGNDPHDPRDNIMAGAAYIREMYEMFGSPGFLAAYNAGPGRYRQHVEEGRPLPEETVRYMAMIAPNIEGYSPSGRGVQPAAVYASRPSTPVATPPSTVVASTARPSTPAVVPTTATTTSGPVIASASSSGSGYTPPVVQANYGGTAPAIGSASSGQPSAPFVQTSCPPGSYISEATATCMVTASASGSVPLPDSRPQGSAQGAVVASTLTPAQPPAGLGSGQPGVLGYLPAGTVLPRPVYDPTVTNGMDSLIQSVSNPG
ncbi:MAG: transglycosylase SLT domain-containing protein [Azospirillaceae bacterium]